MGLTAEQYAHLMTQIAELTEKVRALGARIENVAAMVSEDVPAPLDEDKRQEP